MIEEGAVVMFDSVEEDAINDLIDIIWPLLDSGRSKDDVRVLIDDAIDSWEPLHHE